MIVALAGALRVHALGAEGLWVDEGHSLAMARLPPSEAVTVISSDMHPPLYFLMLGGWTRAFGESDESLRAPSVVFGTLAVAALYFLGRRLGGEAVGLVAALLLAVSPFQVKYAQDARPYALLLLLSVLSTIALLRLAEAPRPWTRRLAYAVSAAAVLYTHATGLFVLAFHGAWALLRLSRRGPAYAPGFGRGLVASGAVGLLLFAPWVPALFAQTRSYPGRLWIEPITWKAFYRVVFDHAGGELAFATWVPLAAAGLATSRVWSPAVAWPRSLAVLASAVPLLAPAVVSVVGSPIFIPRATLVSSVGWVVLVAAGVVAVARRVASSTRLAPHRRRVLGLATAAGVLAVSLGFSGRTLLVQYARPHNAQLREAVARIEGEAHAGDAVLVSHAFESTVVDHYLRRRDLVLRTTSDPLPLSGRRVWLPVIFEPAFAETRRALEAAGFRAAAIHRYRHVALERYDRG